MARGRNWNGTINNYTEEDITSLRDANAKYVIFGKEIAPTTGTPHLQVFIAFKNAVRPSTLKKLNPRAHWKPVAVRPWDAAAYCKKDGDFEEWGTPPLPNADKGAKEKARWENARTLAREGKFDEIDADIWIRYDRNLEREYARARPPPSTLGSLDNEWHYGPTGTGKSRGVREAHPTAYIKDPESEFWDGYTDQEVVVIEDLDKYHVKLGYKLKLWADHYPFPVADKGKGQRMIRPKKIIITSNYEPCEIWEDQKTIGPICRRFRMVPYGEPEGAFVSFFRP